MMINPEVFYKNGIKGKNVDKILFIMKGLRIRIGMLKRKIEHPRYNEQIHTKSDDKTKISCYRLYWSEALDGYTEAGGDYKPSKSEQKTELFNYRLSELRRIIYEVNAFFSGNSKYIVEFNGGNAVLQTYKLDTQIVERTLEKAELLEVLRNLYIGEWLRYYTPERFGYYALDGVQWSL